MTYTRSAGEPSVTELRGRRAAGAVLVALGLALGLAGCAGGQAASVAPVAPVATADGVHRVELAFADGSVASGPARYAVPLGSTVELVVGSDVADEVHLHGYDLLGYVTANATTTLRFVADVPGVFEVELEQQGVQLTQLEVS